MDFYLYSAIASWNLDIQLKEKVGLWWGYRPTTTPQSLCFLGTQVLKKHFMQLP